MVIIIMVIATRECVFFFLFLLIKENRGKAGRRECVCRAEREVQFSLPANQLSVVMMRIINSSLPYSPSALCSQPSPCSDALPLPPPPPSYYYSSSRFLSFSSSSLPFFFLGSDALSFSTPILTLLRWVISQAKEAQQWLPHSHPPPSEQSKEKERKEEKKERKKEKGYPQRIAPTFFTLTAHGIFFNFFFSSLLSIMNSMREHKHNFRWNGCTRRLTWK